MIALLSDLHLSDRTCGTFHLPVQAFVGVFQDLDAHARRAGERELDLLLLGDVFDLIHTELWLGVPEERQPWGEAPSHGLILGSLRAVIAAHSEVFELFRGGLARHFEQVETVRVHYVPGNHDRLVNVCPRTRRLVTETLGLQRADPDAAFPPQFVDRRHSLFARHGHEFDPWNHERESADSARPAVVIGDVITAMLLSKLPRLVGDSLRLYHEQQPEAIELSEVSRIAWSFKDLFDVRPFAALIAWLVHQVESVDDPAVREIVDCAVNQTARDFLEMRCVQQWMQRDPFHGSELGGLCWLMARLPVLSLRSCRGPLDEVVRYVRSDDRYHRGALQDLRRYGVRHVAYGHTHEPVQRPLIIEGSGPTRRETFYLNTGTWRPTYEESLDRRGFVARKGLTYTIIYSPDQGHPAPHPIEAWTGTACERPNGWPA